MTLSLKHARFHDVPNPIWVIDRETLRFLDVNDAACVKYGYTRDEFVKLSLYDVRAPGETERHGAEHLGSGRPWEHRTKSGESLFVEGHILPLDESESHRVLMMVFDVTERVRMERERSELLKRYQILSEAANDLLWDWDLRTNRVTHNGVLVSVYGYDPSHLQEDIYWWATLIHPDDYEVASWSIQQAIREKRRYWSAEYRFRKADGTYIPVFDRGILQTDEHENPVRMIGSIVDLTTRQAAEDERKQLFRLSRDCMLMLDPSGTITMSNAAFQDLVGDPSVDEQRQNFQHYLCEDDIEPFKIASERALTEGTECNFRSSISTDGGRGRIVQWDLMTNEARSRLFLVGREITKEIAAQNELERAFARSQELTMAAQAATKAQTEFLQNMSHELRTPMNGLLGTAQLLAASASSDRQRHYASILIQSGESLLQILNDILDFSKVEAGEISLDSAPFLLPDVIQTVFDLFSLPAHRKHLNLTSSVDPRGQVMVLGDQYRLRQAINNLVGNAIKFTDHGSIHVAIEVEPKFDRKIEAVISVRDTGMGIDPSMHEKVFSRFVQADASLTRRHGGTGLGLSITKTLVELMKGTITLESQLGHGSLFTIRIPFQTVESVDTLKAPKVSQKVSVRPGSRVLIAEDVEVNAIILTSWLEDRGFECITAATGREAIDLLRDDRFDGLFLDLHMPDFSGYEVIGMIRDVERGTAQRLPVVAVTASVSHDERQKCLSSGFDDYIPKPVMVEDLDRVITRLFSTKS